MIVNLQTFRLYRIRFDHSLMILVDSNLMSSYDFVRYSETSRCINFIAIYGFQGEGEDFVYIKWKKNY